MAYKKEEITKIVDEVCDRLEKGESLRNILKDDHLCSNSTFYSFIDNDETKLEQYTRAKKYYAEKMFEDLLDIADGSENDVIIDADGNKQVNHNVIQRDRLRIDTRKWHLSKLYPKKYGDKLDVTSDGEKITTPVFGSNPLDE